MIKPFGSAAEGTNAPVVVDVPDVRTLLHAARPDFTDATDEGRAAVLLLAGPLLGFNIDRLTKRTRYARQFVAMCARRLFDNGVWRHEGPMYCWEDPRDPNFWRDVEVAVGRSYRRSLPEGGVEWGDTSSWRKKYDFGQDPNAGVGVVYLTGNGESPNDAEPSAPAEADPLTMGMIGIFPAPADDDLDVDELELDDLNELAEPEPLEVPQDVSEAADGEADTEVADDTLEVLVDVAETTSEAPAPTSPQPVIPASSGISVFELFPGAQWL